MNILPAGLSYDGIMPTLDGPLHCFTEKTPGRASFGASFCLPVAGFTLQKLKELRALKLQQFEKAERAQHHHQVKAQEQASRAVDARKLCTRKRMLLPRFSMN